MALVWIFDHSVSLKSDRFLFNINCKRSQVDLFSVNQTVWFAQSLDIFLQFRFCPNELETLTVFLQFQVSITDGIDVRRSFMMKRKWRHYLGGWSLIAIKRFSCSLLKKSFKIVIPKLKEFLMIASQKISHNLFRFFCIFFKSKKHSHFRLCWIKIKE